MGGQPGAARRTQHSPAIYRTAVRVLLLACCFDVACYKGFMASLLSRYLVEGRKLHLRLYVVVRDVEPLRVFLFKDGLALFASEVYSVSKRLPHPVL